MLREEPPLPVQGLLRHRLRESQPRELPDRPQRLVHDRVARQEPRSVVLPPQHPHRGPLRAPLQSHKEFVPSTVLPGRVQGLYLQHQVVVPRAPVHHRRETGGEVCPVAPLPDVCHVEEPCHAPVQGLEVVEQRGRSPVGRGHPSSRWVWESPERTSLPWGGETTRPDRVPRLRHSRMTVG